MKDLDLEIRCKISPLWWIPTLSMTAATAASGDLVAGSFLGYLTVAMISATLFMSAQLARDIMRVKRRRE